MLCHILLSPAEAEFVEALDYYESVSKVIALRFVEAFDEGIRLICEYPAAWVEFDPPVRRFVLSGFPYGILYYTDKGKVVVLAVMHLMREPTYWKKRI